MGNDERSWQRCSRSSLANGLGNASTQRARRRTAALRRRRTRARRRQRRTHRVGVLSVRLWLHHRRSWLHRWRRRGIAQSIRPGLAPRSPRSRHEMVARARSRARPLSFCSLCSLATRRRWRRLRLPPRWRRCRRSRLCRHQRQSQRRLRSWPDNTYSRDAVSFSM